jgi:hypothetical protein
MTTQEAFDAVWDWFVIQRARRGWDVPVARCVYRGSDGCRCPIGRLLPDHLYNPSMEGSSISQLIENFSDIEEHFTPCDVAFLNDLQLVHDNSVSAAGGYDFNGYMQKKLRELAEVYELVIPSTPIPEAPQVEGGGYRPQYKQR